MAAFLAGRHGLTSIGVVAHGSYGGDRPGNCNPLLGKLPRAIGPSLRQLARSRLRRRNRLLEFVTWRPAPRQPQHVVEYREVHRRGLAASSHPVGSAAAESSWQLDRNLGGAAGKAPFSAAAAVHFTRFCRPIQRSPLSRPFRRQFLWAARRDHVDGKQQGDPFVLSVDHTNSIIIFNAPTASYTQRTECQIRIHRPRFCPFCG